VKLLVWYKDFMMSIDFNQTFYHIPLSNKLRKFFTFNFIGKQYYFNCLLFSFTASLRIFTKILQPIIKLENLSNGLFEWYSNNYVNQETGSGIRTVYHFFSSDAKFHNKWGKSSLIPSKVVNCLEFQINSKIMIINLPKYKIKDLI
jgi:hypothetical protein